METKKCSHCEETSLTMSKVCRYCGRSFDDGQTVLENEQEPMVQSPFVEDFEDTSPYDFSNKGLFKRPFSFEGRIRRLEYGLSILIYMAYAVVLGVIMGMLLPSYSDSTILIHLLLLPGYYFILAQGAKRCHDRNNSGWYQFIPLYYLWMIFADGDDDNNDYGDSPK